MRKGKRKIVEKQKNNNRKCVKMKRGEGKGKRDIKKEKGGRKQDEDR